MSVQQWKKVTLLQGEFWPLIPWQLASPSLLISSCLFSPLVLHWLLPWFSCPGSWPGLWERWGCWWEHRGTGRNGTPAALSLAPEMQDVLVLAGAQFDTLSGAMSSTYYCDLVCWRPACPSGFGHTKAAAEPGRSKHVSCSGPSAGREAEQKYATMMLEGLFKWWHAMGIFFFMSVN